MSTMPHHHAPDGSPHDPDHVHQPHAHQPHAHQPHAHQPHAHQPHAHPPHAHQTPVARVQGGSTSHTSRLRSAARWLERRASSHHAALLAALNLLAQLLVVTKIAHWLGVGASIVIGLVVLASAGLLHLAHLIHGALVLHKSLRRYGVAHGSAPRADVIADERLGDLMRQVNWHRVRPALRSDVAAVAKLVAAGMPGSEMELGDRRRFYDFLISHAPEAIQVVEDDLGEIVAVSVVFGVTHRHVTAHRRCRATDHEVTSHDLVAHGARYVYLDVLAVHPACRDQAAAFINALGASLLTIALTAHHDLRLVTLFYETHTREGHALAQRFGFSHQGYAVSGLPVWALSLGDALQMPHPSEGRELAEEVRLLQRPKGGQGGRRRAA